MQSDSLKRVQIDQLLAHFRRGFEPFVIVVFKSTHAESWYDTLRTTPEVRLSPDSRALQLDATALVRIILAHWDTTFARVLDKRDRALLYELRQIRNRWAHQAPLNDDDVDRMADAVLRLLTSIHADNVAEVQALRDNFRTERYGHRPPFTVIPTRWILVGCSVVLVIALGVWWYGAQAMPVAQVPAATPTHTTLTHTTTSTYKSSALLPTLTRTLTQISDQDASYPCAKGQIKANPNTKIYHKPDGAYYAATRNSNVVCFDTVAAAEQAGYRAAKR